MIRCSKSITRKPLTNAFGGIAVDEAPDGLVAEVEAEPDHDLEAEIGPAAREHTASGCDDGGHMPILVGLAGVTNHPPM